MKAKAIVKCHTLLSIEDRKKIADYILNAWSKDGIVVQDATFDMEKIICIKEDGGIEVINLKESSVKSRKNILKKIKKLFKRKNKG